MATQSAACSRGACPCRQHGEHGLTLVELMVSGFLVTVMMFLVVTLSVSGTDAQKYSERLNRCTEIAQDIVDDMCRSLTSSVRLFQGDALGNAYLTALQDPTNPAPLNSFLPTLDPLGVFAPEAAPHTKTGNLLFFARQAWTSPYDCPTSGTRYRVDVYRMVCYYLAPEDGGPQAGRAFGLNLGKFIGEPLIDGAQIDAIVDPVDQQEVLVHFLNRLPDGNGVVHPKAEVVWRVGGDPATVGTFRQITATGALSDAPLLPRPVTWEVRRDVELSSAGLLHFRHHSVATNFAQASMGVGRFSVRDTAGQGFPHGFEVQMIGPSSARQVLIHLSIVSTNNKGAKAPAQVQVVHDAHDL